MYACSPKPRHNVCRSHGFGKSIRDELWNDVDCHRISSILFLSHPVVASLIVQRLEGAINAHVQRLQPMRAMRREAEHSYIVSSCIVDYFN